MGAGPRGAELCSGREGEGWCWATLAILRRKAGGGVRPAPPPERQPALTAARIGDAGPRLWSDCLHRPDGGVLSFLYWCGMHTGCFGLRVSCEVVRSHRRTPGPCREGQASPTVMGSPLLLFTHLLAPPTGNVERFISDRHSRTHTQGLVSPNVASGPSLPLPGPLSRLGLPPPHPSPLTCAGLTCWWLVWCW